MQEVTYEGYGPSGTAFLIEVATDNLNRAAQDVRTIFSKNAGAVATPGAVAYQFDRKGQLIVAAERFSADAILELAVLAGADDVISDETEHCILTSPQNLASVADALREQGVIFQSESLVFVPQTPVMLDDPLIAKQALKLYELFDSYDDTHRVFTNFELSDAVLAQIED